jgi:serine/threonine-protein kinase
MPPPELGTIVVETDPPGAQVSVDGKVIGKSPVTLPDQKLGKHEISARLERHRPMTTSLTVEAGAKASVLLPLAAIEVAPAVAEAKPPPAPVADAKQAAQPAPVQPPPAAKKPPPRPVAAMGKVSLSTQPWTKVTWNGKALGDTPLIDVVLPAGKQLLKLVNEEKGVNTSIEVEITPGQTTKKVLKL